MYYRLKYGEYFMNKIKSLLLSKKLILIFSSIKSGMIYAMPLFIIGSIGLVIQYAPITAFEPLMT